MNNYLYDLQDRVARLELRMADEHFKKLCSVTVRVALGKLETSNREQVQRLESIIKKGQDKMDSTIIKMELLQKNKGNCLPTRLINSICVCLIMNANSGAC